MRHPAGLDRHSPVPLYHQLERALLELIVSSGMTADSRFPSEAELSARFGVTRPTVRQALERLVRVGVLRKERGRGTYVAAVPESGPAPERGGRLTVKVIMPSLTDLIHLRVLSGIAAEAHRAGLQVLLAHSDNRPATQAAELAAVEGCAGVLLWPVAAGGPADVDPGGPPVVYVDRYGRADRDHVVVDNHGGAAAVTDHLVGIGHRRIAFVHAEARQLSSIRERLAGYRAGLRRAGLDFDRGLVLRVGAAPGPAVAQLLARPDPPTAAFCVNDVVAVQVFTALRDGGVAVPQQLSVAGFDALEVLPSAGVLTSVRRATGSMGREAVRLLVQRLREPAAPPRHVRLPATLVPGDTTAPPPDRTAAADRPAPAGRPVATGRSGRPVARRA